MKNLILIPARKNSKRIKNKNILKIQKKPLIYWTINFAKKFKNCDLIISSDCKKVEKLCNKENVYYLKRPNKISSDNTSIYEVIFNTLNKIKKQYNYIILLQPTSPLRKISLVNKAIKILNKNKEFDSLLHLEFDKSFTGKLKKNVWEPDYKLNKRTQDINDKLVPTGNLYIYRSHLFKKDIKLPKKTFGLVTNNETWVDIDDKRDLAILDFYLKKPKNRRILVYNQ